MAKELTRTQLEIIVHVANGLRYEEIAALTHRSESSVRKILLTARVNAEANSTAHLVSIVIATGVLEWRGNERRLNGTSEGREANPGPLPAASTSYDSADKQV